MKNNKFDVVGKRVVPIDVKEKAMGTAEYVTDMKLPGMLYEKILRSPYAHANILSIDTSEAKKIPGVKAVITFEDTPKIPFGTGCGRNDWYILAKDKVRFVGDEVAAVAAIDEETAEKALELIHVEYEELPVVLTPKDAIKKGAPIIHEDCPDNIAYHTEVERGDVDKAFKDADLVVKGTYSTSQAYQAYLEPKAAVAQWDAYGKLTMWLPVQVPMKCRIVYAKALGLDPGRLRVIKPYMGGGFGAKFEYMAHLICAELARHTGKPVKVVNTRREDFIAGNPRVPMEISIELALKKDGRFIGKKVYTLAGNGGRTVYGPPIASTTCYRIDALYDFQNVRSKADLLYTNTAPTGCMRGFGNSQMITTFEQLLDRAAEKLDIDPIEIRLKNAYKDGDVNLHGWELNTCGLAECLEKARNMSDWEKKYGKKRQKGRLKKGIGIASTMHVSGNRAFFKPFDGASSLIRIGEEGQVTLVHGECDMGQGQDTAFAQIACEALGARYEDFSVATVDTQISSLGCGSFSTRGTTLGGQGAIAAAKDAKGKILEAAGEILERPAKELDASNGIIFEKETGKEVLTFAEAAKHYVFEHGGMPVTGVGYWKPPTVVPKNYYGNCSPVYPYGAHIAEVEVDEETGRVDVVNYWAVHDVGRVINPTLLEGQLEGGIVQGIGWALTEDMIYDEKGVLQNDNFLDYRIPGSNDVPRIYTDFVESNDPNGPFGAKGIGEPALNPVAAAVSNAIYDAIGVRFYEIPITPEKILKGLAEKEKNKNSNTAANKNSYLYQRRL